MALSDDEAGLLMKALWSYTMTGEKQTLSGAEKGIFALILMTLSQDEANNAELSKKRSLAGAIGGKQRVANQANACFAIEIEAKQANDINKSKEKDKETDKELFIDDDNAREVNEDHNRVLEAARDAGFTLSNGVMAELIAMYADNGLQKVLDGLKSCVEHGAPTLAYLRACLRGEPRKKKADVSAQRYEQRDYGGEQEEAMARMIALGGSRNAG
jgi:hypothetical protein